MTKDGLRCQLCGSLDHKKINDHQVKCTKCNNVYDIYEHTGFNKTIIQNADFISIEEKLSMIRGLIAGKQFKDALDRLDCLNEERGGMDEFQFLKAQALSQDFTISDDVAINNLLTSAECMASRNQNRDLQEEILEARQKLARAEAVRPIREKLKNESIRLSDAQNIEQDVLSDIETLKAQQAQIYQDISVARSQLRQKGRAYTLNRCLRVIPLILGFSFLFIATSTALRTFPQAAEFIKQKLPNICNAIDNLLANHPGIPFINNTPTFILDAVAKIPVLDKIRFSVDIDLALTIISAVFALILLKLALKNKRAKTLKESIISNKSQISSIKERLQAVSSKLSDKQKELEIRTKNRQAIENNVNTLQAELIQFIGE